MLLAFSFLGLVNTIVRDFFRSEIVLVALLTDDFIDFRRLFIRKGSDVHPVDYLGALSFWNLQCFLITRFLLNLRD